VVKGYEASEKEYGTSMLNLNLMAFMGSQNEISDAMLVNRLIVRIGDQWYESQWQSYGRFEAIKKWAASYGPTVDQRRLMEAAADANIKTPEAVFIKLLLRKNIRNWSKHA
jgi:hypothetical protein